MLTEIYIEALLVDEDLADAVLEVVGFGSDRRAVGFDSVVADRGKPKISGPVKLLGFSIVD